MKARDHQRILRDRLNALREYMLGEIVERDGILDNYADALDRQDAEIAILTRMLIFECGVDSETVAKRVMSELAKLNDDEVRQ